MSIWPQERIDELRAHVEAGLTCAQIAEKMGGRYNRNAVIGKLHRLKLQTKNSKMERPLPKKRVRKPSLKITAWQGNPDRPPPTPFEIAEVVSNPRNLNIVDLGPDDCRYPYGDGPFVFCAHQKVLDTPYCYAHLMLCIPGRN
jgi:GcrA cell cycle regulator